MQYDILSRWALPLGGSVAALLCWGIYSAFERMKLQRKRRRRARIDATSADAGIGAFPIECAESKVRIALGAVAATPIVMVASYMSALKIDVVVKDADSIAGLGIAGFLLWGVALFRWRRTLRLQREIQWYYNAKAMVDRAVAPLAKRGYAVLRDFKAEQLSIHHLLVGPKGVFTIQTLVNSMASKSDQMIDATATYDGRTVFFPNKKDHLSIEAAEKSAENLSEWISRTLEAPIAARAIIAVPGWQIKRISAEGISVINPSQMEALFQYIKPRPLSEAAIHQIVQQIEPHCERARETQNATAVSETAC